MYELLVFEPGESSPRHIETADSANAAMAALPRLLRDHPGCHRIEVRSGQTRLFSVDCHGNRMD